MVLWKIFPQGIQQWKSVLNLQEVKTPFSAMSPPPPGSDDTVLHSFRLMILHRAPMTVWLFTLTFWVTSDREEQPGGCWYR